MKNCDSSKDKKRPESLQPLRNLHVYKIILCVEFFLILALATAIVVVKISHPTPNNAPQALDISACKHRTKEEIINLLEGITKDEAISIIKSMNSETKCIPEGLVPDKLKLQSNEFAQKILYSYDDVAEVPSIAQKSVMGSNGFSIDRKSIDDFLIDETTEYYTIISLDGSKSSCEKNSCYRGISFNRKYLNHHEVIEGVSHYDEMVFNDLTPEFVELALKIIIATDIWNGNSLYDYYFEDNGDNYTLTGIYFGVGVDMNNLEGVSAYNIPYAINIYEKKLNLNKNTKKVSWEKYNSDYSEESSSNIIKSFSLSNDDIIGVQAAIYGLNDDEVAELKAQYRDEDELTDAERLEARVVAICGNDYSTIFSSSDNEGIFKCNDYSKAVYSISNPDKTEQNYKNIAHATFLGTDDDEIVNEFFNNNLYIYQSYRHSEIPDRLFLLLESPSEGALIENNIDAIYDYVKKINEDYITDLILYIFYTDNLSQTDALKDYIVISAVDGLYLWLPNGNGFGSYYYQEEEEVTSLNKMAQNPDLYSSQTRDAIKFHRHIRAEITNGRDITKESLRQLLYNSFENGL